MALIVPSEKSLGQVDGAAEKYIHPYLCESRKHSKNLNRIIINSTTRHEGIYKLFLTFFTCLKLALTRSFTTLASNACRGSSSISLLILAAFCKYFFAQLIVFATPIGAFPEIFQIFIQIIIYSIEKILDTHDRKRRKLRRECNPALHRDDTNPRCDISLLGIPLSHCCCWDRYLDLLWSVEKGAGSKDMKKLELDQNTFEIVQI